MLGGLWEDMNVERLRARRGLAAGLAAAAQRSSHPIGCGARTAESEWPRSAAAASVDLVAGASLVPLGHRLVRFIEEGLGGRRLAVLFHGLRDPERYEQEEHYDFQPEEGDPVAPPRDD